jgi:hypothetical protein
MENPEHMEKMDKAGLAVKVMMEDEYSKYIMSLHERVKKLVMEARKAR